MADRLHWSFADSFTMVEKALPETLSAAKSTLPQGPFDPEADWQNSYDIVYTGFQPFAEDNKVYYGSLHIACRHDADRTRLNMHGVCQLQNWFKFERQHWRATCLCRRDMLYSLQPGSTWTVESRLKNQHDPATEPYAQFAEEGRLESGKIQKKTAAGEWYDYRAVPDTLPVVSNWALCAAVQILGRQQEYGFGYLAQLERFAPDHRIRYFETFDARFRDHDVTLHGYVQAGRGITPSFYWVNDQGRLLLARFALSALIYNPSPRVDKETANDN